MTPTILSGIKITMAQIEKSTRHSHIIGRFGEYMLCNWLSRFGFEVSVLDHTGIDLVAFNPKTKKRMGITVKSRTRNVGKDTNTVNVFSYRNGKDDRQKLEDACNAFGSDPWIAVYVETSQSADLYLTSLQHYDTRYRGRKSRAIDTWPMSVRKKVLYQVDDEVKHLHVEFHQDGWEWQPCLCLPSMSKSH